MNVLPINHTSSVDRQGMSTLVARCIANLTIAAFFAACATRGSQAAELQRFESTQRQMGVPFTITLYAPDAQTANSALNAAFARIAKLNSVLSDYDPESELSRLSAASPTPKPVHLSPDLWNVLNRSQQLSQSTKGSFDVTLGPYTRLWRRARRRGQLPTDERLAQARNRSGYKHLKLDPAKKTASLAVANMRIDLGGIAKGYAADKALRLLKARGLSHAMVNGSGDITLGDPPPGKKFWRIGVAPLKPPVPGKSAPPPSHYLRLANCAVATSGDAFQHVEIGGTRYSHIINPATGLGLTQRSSVTVIAPDGITADSLASAVSVLGPTAGTKLIESQPKTESIIVHQSPNQTTVQTTRSSGIKHYTEQHPKN